MSLDLFLIYVIFFYIIIQLNLLIYMTFKVVGIKIKYIYWCDKIWSNDNQYIEIKPYIICT